MTCQRPKIVSINLRRQFFGMPVGHSLMHMGISGGHFGVGMAELFLNQTDVFGFAIEISAAAMTEDMARVAMMFEVAAAEDAVHDIANAIAADPAEVMTMVGNDGGGEGAIFGGARTSCKIAFQNGEGGVTRVNHPPMTFTTDIDGTIFPVNIFITEAVNFDTERLAEMQNDGIINIKENTIKMTEASSPLVRNVAALLDPLMQNTDKTFSKPI